MNYFSPDGWRSTPADRSAESASDRELGALLRWGTAELRGLGAEASFDAERLMSAVLGITRAQIYAFPEREVPAQRAESYRSAIARRSAGEPTAYIAGHCGFHALELEIDRAVLVPRPETELLVDEVLTAIAPGQRRSVLELGTGSGAIALAVKHARPGVRLTAVDVSAAALIVARSNGQRLGLSVDWRRSDWFSGVTGMRFDVIVTNPPYVASGDPHLAALSHEPRLALDGGVDGLTGISTIIALAGGYLEQDGLLMLEHGYDQAAAVAALAQRSGFSVAAVRRDLGGHERVSVLRVQS